MEDAARASAERRRVIGVSLLALLVLVLAFVPWGEVRVSERLFEGPSLGGAIRIGFTPVVEIDGWNGYVVPLGVKVPNAVVVLAALAVALLCGLRRAGVWAAPAWVLVVLVAYGIGHSGRVVLALAGGDGATLGAGSVLTLGCWVGIAAVLARTRTASEPGG